MKAFIRSGAMVMLALFVALVLAACGASTSPSGPAAAAPTAAAQVATTPTTARPTEQRSATPTSEPTSQPEATSAPSAAPTSAPAGVGSGPSASGVEVKADIKQFRFQPSPLEVQAGTTVIWTNQDDIEHSVTHGDPPTPAGAFDSGLFTKGGSFSFTFSEPGTYNYFCSRHPSMQGVVEVTAP